MIGAGIVGASCAFHLARSGASVTLIDKAPAAATGSTGRSAAGIRHQFSLEENVRFSLYSSAAFHRFTEEVGADAGYREVGYLFLLPEQQVPAWHRQQAMQRALGAEVERLDTSELTRRYPFVATDGVAEASFGPRDGVLDPHGITFGYLAAAQRYGARLRFGAAVTALEPNRGAWTVVVGTDRLRADVVVNAAGAWAGGVAALAGLAVPVVPLRRNIYLTAPLPEVPHPTPLIIDLATGVYLRSEGNRVLFGLSNPDEPAGFDLTVDWHWLDTLLEQALPRFPFLARAALDRRGCWAGLYAVTPDHLPILGRSRTLAGFVNACGFSGHGVQHAPATGLAIAEEVFDGEAHSFDLRPFRLDRFAAAAEQVERNIV